MVDLCEIVILTVGLELEVAGRRVPVLWPSLQDLLNKVMLFIRKALLLLRQLILHLILLRRQVRLERYDALT